MPPGRDIEVGVVGREGMVGAAILLGDELAADRAFVQMAGTSLRLPGIVLLSAAEKSVGLRSPILRHLRVLPSKSPAPRCKESRRQGSDPGAPERIILRDREEPQDMGNGGYGLPEAEYERLIGAVAP